MSAARFIVLTSPNISKSSTNSLSSSIRMSRVSAAFHLHLFKSTTGEERELERLEINEDSIVFVADADVAGRRSVVKVGGIDVGVRRKELNAEIEGRTLWLLHIPNSSESQNWITAIKDAILIQRYLVVFNIPSFLIDFNVFRAELKSLASVKSLLNLK